MQPVSPPIAPDEYDKDISITEINKALMTLYPHVRENEFTKQTTSLPRRWDLGQASSYLELSTNYLTVSFKNISLEVDKDPSGVVRADNYIPSSVGTYYFEVRILHGHRGCMGVGLSKHGGELNRMPGWDPHCFGYHGDDGNFFSACGHGKPYGPRFGTGDVIGCGIDTVLNYVFFTKNGKHLGIAYQGTFGELEEMYPTVGLKTPGERVHVNFGQSEFVFDFEAYRDHLNNQKIHILENVTMPNNITKYMDRVVTSFLGHCGALETLKSFEKVSKCQRPINHEYLKKRKEIVDMVMNGEHGSVIQERLEQLFPGSLETDNKVHLLLLCLRYVDLARTLQKPPISFHSSTNEPGRSQSPTEIRSRPPKLLKGSHCKSTKRTREAQKRNNQSHTPPPVRRTDAKAAEDLCLQNSKIEKFFIDEDTGEDMICIDGISLPKKMYVELYNSEEYGKLSYMLKMGREIMSLSSKTRHKLDKRDREIVEISISMVMGRNANKHPLNNSQRRYIANLMVEMMNTCALPGTSSYREIPDSPEAIAAAKNPGPPSKENRIYSELRGLFLSWQGIHEEYARKDGAVSGIYFMRNMVLEDLSFEDKRIEYSAEPMEQSNDKPQEVEAPAHVDVEADNGMVVEEADGHVPEEADADGEEDV